MRLVILTLCFLVAIASCSLNSEHEAERSDIPAVSQYPVDNADVPAENDSSVNVSQTKLNSTITNTVKAKNQVVSFSSNVGYSSELSIRNPTPAISKQEKLKWQMQRIRILATEQSKLKVETERLEKLVHEARAQNRLPDEQILRQLEECRIRWKLQQAEWERLYREQVEHHRLLLEEEERASIGNAERMQLLAERRSHWQRIWTQFQQRMLREQESRMSSTSDQSKQQGSLSNYQDSRSAEALQKQRVEAEQKRYEMEKARYREQLQREDSRRALEVQRRRMQNEERRRQDEEYRRQEEERRRIYNINEAQRGNWVLSDSRKSNRKLSSWSSNSSWNKQVLSSHSFAGQDCEEREQFEQQQKQADEQQIAELVRLSQMHQKLLKMQQKRQWDEIFKMHEERKANMLKQYGKNDCDHNHECDCNETSSTMASVSSSTTEKSEYGKPYTMRLEPTD